MEMFECLNVFKILVAAHREVKWNSAAHQPVIVFVE